MEAAASASMGSGAAIARNVEVAASASVGGAHNVRSVEAAASISTSMADGAGYSRSALVLHEALVERIGVD